MMGGGSSSGKALTVQETWEGRYEQLMEQFASDMCLYMRWVVGRGWNLGGSASGAVRVAPARGTWPEAALRAPSGHAAQPRPTRRTPYSPPPSMVCDTIVTTVPKSVVHCLVRKAEKNLLNHLFGFVHKMSPEELQRMLQVRTPPQGFGSGLGSCSAAAAAPPVHSSRPRERAS
jgi:hypothetical protein